jgi:GNAT superfamily N-acetyltransferase
MNPAVTVFIAEDGEETIGFVAAVVQQRLDTPLGWAQIILAVDQIGVAPSLRRRGVGHALFTAVRELADQVSANRIALTTWSFNVEAHRFFEAEGLATELNRMTMPWPAH